MRFRTGLAVLATVLAACASGSDLPTTDETTTPATATPTTENETTTMPTSDQEQHFRSSPRPEPISPGVLASSPTTWKSYPPKRSRGPTAVWVARSRGCHTPRPWSTAPRSCSATTTGFTCITPAPTASRSSARPKTRTAATRWSPLLASTADGRPAAILLTLAVISACAAPGDDQTDRTIVPTTGESTMPDSPTSPRSRFRPRRRGIYGQDQSLAGIGRSLLLSD